MNLAVLLSTIGVTQLLYVAMKAALSTAPSVNPAGSGDGGIYISATSKDTAEAGRPAHGLTTPGCKSALPVSAVFYRPLPH